MDYETNRIITQEELDKMGEELSNYAESLINQQFKKISNDMNYEKKYKEALELARVAAFNGHQSLMEGIFPELKESEDEKIRKTLIRFFKDQYPNETEMYDGSVTVGKAIAWLEKQGEQSSLNINRECLKGIKRVQEYQDLSDWEKEFDNIASMYAHNKNQEGYNDSWYVKERAAEMLYYAKKELEKQGGQKPTDEVGPITQSYIIPNGKFFQWIYDRLVHVHNENPNVDYMLSLKKRIEDMQNPANDDMKEALQTEYEKGRADAIAEIQKSAWSCEDETRLQACLDILQANSLMGTVDTVMTNWLKSLKQRCTWKPSDEQMKALDSVIDEYDGYPEFDSLVSLKNDLRKL